MDGLIFTYLSIFPFGKLLGALPDIIILLICFADFIKRKKITINYFLIVCVFSIFYSLSIFSISEELKGIMYLIRLISYFYFSYIIALNFKNKKLLLNSLIVVGIFIAVFGILQYLIFPDTRGLKTLGWDDHYYRLISTLLDPAFTGILLILTIILTLAKAIKTKSKLMGLINVFLLIAILLTYSRATFAGLFFALSYLFYKTRKKIIIYLLFIFLILIPLLPKNSGGEGVNLARTYSIQDRLENYKLSLEIIKRSPLFGVGFNNICAAKEKLLQKESGLHSCSGLDNSMLFVIAATGIIGLISFISFVFEVIKSTKEINKDIIIASLIAIFVHGLFSNTFFYNFVLGWMALLIGATRKNSKDYISPSM